MRNERGRATYLPDGWSTTCDHFWFADCVIESDTAPTCSFPRYLSSGKICDIFGNVSEWTADFHCTGASVDNSPLNNCTTGYRTIRGGSYETTTTSYVCGNGAAYRILTSARPRQRFDADSNSPTLGFRLARDVD